MNKDPVASIIKRLATQKKNIYLHEKAAGYCFKLGLSFHLATCCAKYLESVSNKS